MTRVCLSISGMHCDRCVDAVRGAIAAIRGVATTEVNVGEAIVEYDPAAVALSEVVNAVRHAGQFAVESFEVRQ